MPRVSSLVIDRRVQATGMRYMLRSNFAGRILTDVGIPRPEPQNVDAFALLNMSQETLGEYADADVIIVATDAGDAAGDFERQLLESAQWQTLTAVQNDSVLVVENAVWIGGVGYSGARRLLDDIAAYFHLPA